MHNLDTFLSIRERVEAQMAIASLAASRQGTSIETASAYLYLNGSLVIISGGAAQQSSKRRVLPSHLPKA